MSKLTYIDLFSGCGGFSLGMEQAGFELVLAVEKSDMAAETFYHNLISPLSSTAEWREYCGLDPLEQLQSRLVVDELLSILESETAMKALRARDVDLVVGGPPCQGFSMAGRRNPEDARNNLPWQFITFVERLSPKAVIIENVVGMRQHFAKHSTKAPFEDLREALERTSVGYVVQAVELHAEHFGLPQHRPRLMMLALRNDVARRVGATWNRQLWKSESDEARLALHRPHPIPTATFFGQRIRTVRHALWDINDDGYAVPITSQRYSCDFGEYARRLRSESSGICQQRQRLSGAHAGIANHVLRNHSDQTTTRFRLYQYLHANGIKSSVLGIPKRVRTAADARRKLEILLTGAKLPAQAPDGTTLARTNRELVELVMDLATKKHTQRPLDWNSPSPTVLTLPDDFVHPSLPRILTVRELARLQSFPDSFVFRAKETTGSMRRRFEVPQYTQVGNAVPPLLARAVGCVFADLLDQWRGTKSVGNRKRTAARADSLRA